MRNKLTYLLMAGAMAWWSACPLHAQTDVTETYLKNNPGNAGYFSKLPKDWKERVRKRFERKEPEYNQELLGYITEAFKDGVSRESVEESFKDYQINGKKITKKMLTAHIDKAMELSGGNKPETEE